MTSVALQMASTRAFANAEVSHNCLNRDAAHNLPDVIGLQTMHRNTDCSTDDWAAPCVRM